MEYRRLKVFLNLPLIIADITISKLIRYVPMLNYKYKQLAAIVDDDKSITKSILKEEPKKLKISDIKNTRFRLGLILSGKWNIYFIRNNGVRNFNISDNNRDVIYCSKDRLNIGDTIYAERVSDYKLNSNYNNIKRYLYKKFKLDYDEFYKVEPQMYIVAAKHSNKHDSMQIERTNRYAKNEESDIKKAVDSAISDDYLYANYKRKMLLHYLIETDRIDYVKKLLDSTLNTKEALDLLSYINDNGHTAKYYIKSDSMRELLNKYYQSNI